ncbi:MAG: hypothetical protein IPJ77_00350 [Planctomycetes bacterium]|nr:hypothetical protein [Planctomycetota bacterium]
MLNPILVKELRSALRGRYFRILFPFTLLSATVIAVLVLVDRSGFRSDTLGRDLFQAMYACLLFAVTGLVPFSAFLSMGNEWDEHTYDLLVLSRLRPLQIALGKLLSAGIEGLLYFSAFTPLLVFAFLLRGIDITSIVLLLVGAWVASASTSAVALALSSLSRLRIVRVVLMALLAAILFGANIGANAFVDDYLRSPSPMDTVEDWQTLILTLSLMGLPGLLALAVASSRLAHAEENASTAPRVLMTGLLVFLLGMAVWAHAGSPSRHGPFVMGLLLLMGVALCDLFFVTERESLSRRVRLLVPQGRVRALLAAPFLPGGGRGVLLFFLHVVLILAAVAIQCVGWGTGGGRTTGEFTSVGVFAAYVVVYLGLPMLVGSRWTDDPRMRLLLRVLIPVGTLLSVFVPALVGFLVDLPQWTRMEHPLDPVWVAVECGIDGYDARALGVAAVVVAGLVVLLSVPRVVRGLGEVRTAAGERDQRQRALPAEASRAA